MTRLFLIAALTLLLWLGIERLAGRRRAWRGSSAGGRGPAAPPARSRQLLRCEACGIYFPTEQAVGSPPVFCSEECRSRAAGSATG